MIRDDFTNDEYQNRIVLFLDILGYKDIVENATVPEILRSLQSVHEIKEQKLISEYFDNSDQKKRVYESIDKQVTIFSDSIVISFLDTNLKNGDLLDLRMIFDLIEGLQLNLIRFHGKLIRGGITEGSLYHKNNICFGPALNRAYYLESKEAIYPRILVDNCLVTNYEIDKINDNVSYKNEQYYIDFLKRFSEYIKFKYREEDGILFSLLKIQNLILKGLENNDKSILDKYIWLANEYNLIVEPTIEKEGAIEYLGKKITTIPI